MPSNVSHTGYDIVALCHLIASMPHYYNATYRPHPRLESSVIELATRIQERGDRLQVVRATDEPTPAQVRMVASIDRVVLGCYRMVAMGQIIKGNWTEVHFDATIVIMQPNLYREVIRLDHVPICSNPTIQPL